MQHIAEKGRAGKLRRKAISDAVNALVGLVASSYTVALAFVYIGERRIHHLTEHPSVRQRERTCAHQRIVVDKIDILAAWLHKHSRIDFIIFTVDIPEAQFIIFQLVNNKRSSAYRHKILAPEAHISFFQKVRHISEHSIEQHAQLTVSLNHRHSHRIRRHDPIFIPYLIDKVMTRLDAVGEHIDLCGVRQFADESEIFGIASSGGAVTEPVGSYNLKSISGHVEKIACHITYPEIAGLRMMYHKVNRESTVGLYLADIDILFVGKEVACVDCKCAETYSRRVIVDFTMQMGAPFPRIYGIIAVALRQRDIPSSCAVAEQICRMMICRPGSFLLIEVYSQDIIRRRRGLI